MFKLSKLYVSILLSSSVSFSAISLVVGVAEARDLNDTGLGENKYSSEQTDYYFYPKDVVNFPGQDAQYGRDALEQKGDLNKIGSGHSGFDYSSNGGCVVDNVTGLVWETKEKSSSAGIQSNKWNFIWKDDRVNTLTKLPEKTVVAAEKAPNEVSNMDSSSIVSDFAVLTACGDDKETIRCDTQSYIEKMNKSKLCGYNDWRLPTREELRSIVDYGLSLPSIDKDFFPNTLSSAYWTSSINVNNKYRVWVVDFEFGGDNTHEKHRSLPIRLVRVNNDAIGNTTKVESTSNGNALSDFFSPVTNLWK